MGELALAMPSPVPCSSRITEVRVLSYTGLSWPGDHRSYDPLRLPPHRPGLRCGLIPELASAAIDLATGAGGPPQLTEQPSLHAASHTPEGFRAAPESMARTAAFA